MYTVSKNGKKRIRQKIINMYKKENKKLRNIIENFIHNIYYIKIDAIRRNLKNSVIYTKTDNAIYNLEDSYYNINKKTINALPNNFFLQKETENKILKEGEK